MWNPKAHYCVYKSPALVSTLSQISPVHTTTTYRCMIHFLPPSVFLVVSFLQVFPPKCCMHGASFPWMLYSLPLIDLIILLYLSKRTSPEMLRGMNVNWWLILFGFLMVGDMTCTACHYFSELGLFWGHRLSDIPVFKWNRYSKGVCVPDWKAA